MLPSYQACWPPVQMQKLSYSHEMQTVLASHMALDPARVVHNAPKGSQVRYLGLWPAALWACLHAIGAGMVLLPCICIPLQPSVRVLWHLSVPPPSLLPGWQSPFAAYTTVRLDHACAQHC